MTQCWLYEVRVTATGTVNELSRAEKLLTTTLIKDPSQIAADVLTLEAVLPSDPRFDGVLPPAADLTLPPSRSGAPTPPARGPRAWFILACCLVAGLACLNLL